ncbi:hypothetical protein CR194_09240 [Salipaludibacillus keqinensis]|uniref:N-acetyltransferase domain-containing protein n=1 Tax=Salipaludibacillus keqinensis TaxID=2045207 RepID=A0A323TLC7_9BACI|nr:GNAT family protein [Salipaludibacillus keqinensis]PYZ93363.1 hypothetical protein CR194_09240 [Salipaludibacillus keqinensis]
MEQYKPIKFLENKRVYLRPIEDKDVDAFFFQSLWDSEFRRLTGTKAVFTRSAVQKHFETIASDSSRIDLIICLQENDQPIGDIAMMDIDHQNRNAIVRIGIFEQNMWGKGLGTEAMSSLLEYGFQMLNLYRVGLDVFSYNKRGMKAYEKLGFKQEGTIRGALFYNGEYHDSILMGVLKEEFVKV